MGVIDYIAIDYRGLLVTVRHLGFKNRHEMSDVTPPNPMLIMIKRAFSM